MLFLWLLKMFLSAKYIRNYSFSEMIFWLLKHSWLLVLAIQNYSDTVRKNSVFLLKFSFLSQEMGEL